MCCSELFSLRSRHVMLVTRRSIYRIPVLLIRVKLLARVVLLGIVLIFHQSLIHEIYATLSIKRMEANTKTKTM